MRTLHLFAGAGGGLLADLILGHTPIGAVEIDPYCCNVLRARIDDGWFPELRVHEIDIRQFDPSAYTGRVDCVAGGFPCQDISAAGKGAGITGERSRLWSEFARVLRVVRPRYAFIENSPMLTLRGLDVVSLTLPRSGSMRNGMLYPQPKWEPRISENESGYWPTIRATDGDRGGRGDLIQAIRGNPNSHYKTWPTPTVYGNYNRKGASVNSGDGLATAVRMWPTPRASEDNRSPEAYARMQAKRGRGPEDISSLSVAVKLWPTPRARDSQPEGLEAGKRRMDKYSTCGLQTAVAMWPTQIAHTGSNLNDAVSQFPTPTKRDYKGGANWINRQKQGKPRPESDMTLCDVVEMAGGSLNPTWVEWLMGWPLGWTDLNPLAMARSRYKPL